MYDNEFNSIFYLLKYGYAYPYLYYHIYSDILSRCDKDEILNVLSIGCGSKMDLLGLKLAMNASGSKNKVSYYGIELGKWEKNNLCIYTNDGSVYDNSNIVDYLNNTSEICSNIIIFPYSLSELTDNGNISAKSNNMTPWEYICRVLPGKLMADHVFFATPLRAGIIDSNHFDEIVKTMNACGYKVEDSIYFRNVHPNKEKVPINDELKLKDKLGYGVYGPVQLLMRNTINNAAPDIEANPISNDYIISYKIFKFVRKK